MRRLSTECVDAAQLTSGSSTIWLNGCLPGLVLLVPSGMGVERFGERSLFQAHCWVLRDQPVRVWFLGPHIFTNRQVRSVGGFLVGVGFLCGTDRILRTSQWTRASL